jgi:hypothetical protein
VRTRQFVFEDRRQHEHDAVRLHRGRRARNSARNRSNGRRLDGEVITNVKQKTKRPAFSYAAARDLLPLLRGISSVEEIRASILVSPRQKIALRKHLRAEEIEAVTRFRSEVLEQFDLLVSEGARYVPRSKADIVQRAARAKLNAESSARRARGEVPCEIAEALKISRKIVTERIREMNGLRHEGEWLHV